MCLRQVMMYSYGHFLGQEGQGSEYATPNQEMDALPVCWKEKGQFIAQYYLALLSLCWC